MAQDSGATTGGTVSAKKKGAPGASVARRGSALPTGYASWLGDLKVRIRAVQVRAALSVNSELVLLYWSHRARHPREALVDEAAPRSGVADQQKCPIQGLAAFAGS